MKLASFDIFDTTLIRKCGQPENVFYLLAHRLYPSDAAMREAFLLWRRQAEREACAAMPGKELTLQDIYAQVEKQGFVGYTAEALMAAEKTVEAEQLVANPAVKSQLSQLREQGCKVAFISDMYLDSAFLTAVLQREGCLQPGECVFVSCEYGCRKSTGALYDVVRDELKPQEWVHHGDHPVSDVRMARRKGIRAVQIDSSYTDTEQSMRAAAYSLYEPYAGSVLAGLSRYIRLAGGADGFAAMAADFVVPAYAPYLMYLSKEASARGIRRLYFLSRDGYVLQKGMEQLAPDGVELRYLFVSRKALMLPYLHGGDESTYLAVMDKQALLRKHVDVLLAGLSTSRSELAEFGITFAYRQIVTKAQQEDFLQKVFRSNFTPELEKRCAEAHTLLLDYFRQEGLMENVPSAMVDVGWLGTSRLMVKHILSRAESREVEFFYYGVRGDVLPPACGTYSSYLRPEQSCTELTALVENYYSASPWPTTKGYARGEKGMIEATFAKDAAYSSNHIVDSNVQALGMMMQELRKMPTLSDSELFSWSLASLRCMQTLKGNIDLSPLLEAGAFDDSDFVRILKTHEIVRKCFLGGTITSFDLASIRLSVPFPLFCFMRHMHKYSTAARSLAFRIHRKLRNGK